MTEKSFDAQILKKPKKTPDIQIYAVNLKPFMTYYNQNTEYKEIFFHIMFDFI